jgi:acyl-CoA reductase-like NAD-dependent aldehyde dehydrogenase
MKRQPYLVRLTLCFLVVSFCCAAASAQTPKRREHLTDAEIELVRDAQLLDVRMKVFVKAADRRLLALTDPNAANSKEAAKDAEKWGKFPTGTRAELLSDLARILDEAIENIDGLAERKPDDKLLPKAVRLLAAAAKRWQPALEAMRPTAQGDERRYLEEALEYIQSILDAEPKLPAEEKKK